MSKITECPLRSSRAKPAQSGRRVETNLKLGRISLPLEYRYCPLMASMPEALQRTAADNQGEAGLSEDIDQRTDRRRTGQLPKRGQCGCPKTMGCLVLAG